MVLKKLMSGLIEFDNFFSTSHANDFLGGGSYRIIDNTFILDGGLIERNLLLDEFVVVIEQRFRPIKEDYSSFYVRGEGDALIEIICNIDNALNFFKIAKYDNFVQAYESNETMNWVNIGGADVANITHQGFRLSGYTPYTLLNYTLYRSPYVRLYNFPAGYRAVLSNTERDFRLEKYFQDDLVCKLFLDNSGDYKLEIYNLEDEIVYLNESIYLDMGDEFTWSDVDLNIIYKDNVLDYNTAKFSYRNDVMTVHNISDKTYNNLILSIDRPRENTDKIKLSFNNNDFEATLKIDKIKPDEKIDFYVYITKDRNVNTRTKQFSININ